MQTLKGPHLCRQNRATNNGSEMSEPWLLAFGVRVSEPACQSLCQNAGVSKPIHTNNVSLGLGSGTARDMHKMACGMSKLFTSRTAYKTNWVMNKLSASSIWSMWLADLKHNYLRILDDSRNKFETIVFSINTLLLLLWKRLLLGDLDWHQGEGEPTDGFHNWPSYSSQKGHFFVSI